MKFSLFLVTFLVGVVISYAENSNMADQISVQGKTWCVVAPGAPRPKLQAFLDYACGQLNCQNIQPGGSCYEPNTVENHASYALNLFYRARGVCNSQIGLPSVNDPSYGNCRYT